MNEKKLINNSFTINNILILVIAVFSVASIDTVSGATIAYIGDAEPSTFADVQELTKDLNQTILLSPTGKVDAVVFMGDMTTNSGTFQLTLNALNESSLNETPTFFVIGNHEYSSRTTSFPLIQNKYVSSVFPLYYFTPDTQNLTFSTNISNIHLINMNEYWDNSNGDVSTPLYNWISIDLNNSSNYNIVVGHEPLYTNSTENIVNRHVGDSLDADIFNRDRLQNLFVSKNVSIFLGGHIHYASIQNISNVYHVNTGTIGNGVDKGQDTFATITYMHTDNGSLILTQKSENTTWNTPDVTSYTISKMISSSTIPPQPRNLQNNMGNYWVNHTWQAGTGVLTDTYNISVNGVWYNGTDQYYNDSVGASNWSNITVWAWNNSGSGNISALSISQNIQAPSLPLPINITSYSPISPIIDNEGATRTFNLTLNETVELIWYINGTQVSSNSSVTAGNYTNTSAKSGTWNVSAVANNSNGSVMKTWIWIVSDLIAKSGGPYTGTPGVLINFTGSASGGTAPYLYNWSFGDGGTSSIANPAHGYANKGDYTATLTVTDNLGRTSSLDTAPVSVEWVRFINGTVMDSVNKAGIAGVKVFTNNSLSNVTNATGFYSFSINSGTYNITAIFEPAYYSNSTSVSLLGAVVVQDIELLKKPNGTITGRVSNV